MPKNFLIPNLALRFLKSKRYGALAHFMQLASTCGIAAGVCALIIGLSAMNGFEKELHNRVLSLIPAATIEAESGGFTQLNECIKSLNATDGIEACAPTVTLEGVFSAQNDFAPAALIGIDPVLELKVVDIQRFMNVKAEILNDLKTENPIILGAGILKKLKLKIGDKVDLITIDKSSQENPLSTPAQASFTIVGMFKTGGQIDGTLAFTKLSIAENIASLNAPNSIHVKVKNMLDVDNPISRAVINLPQRVEVTTWMQSQGKLYNDINLIRNIMYLAMILVMGVACFNIIANLVMSVSEKSHEIAIMLTMGMRRNQIVGIFTLMGIFSGIRGTFIGITIGCIISSLLSPITQNFEKFFGFTLLNEEIYFINFIPSMLSFTDVLLVSFCAIFMSALASIYPAMKASKIDPANELTI